MCLYAFDDDDDDCFYIAILRYSALIALLTHAILNAWVLMSADVIQHV